MSDAPKPAETAPPAPAKKPTMRRMLILIAILVVIALIPPITNLFTSPPTATALTKLAAGNPDHLNAATLLEKNCLDCHSREGKTPLYARLPIASSLIEKDKADGLRYMDMLEALVAPEGKPVAEAALAKLEYSVESGGMPPTRYVIMHWNRGISSADKEVILNWIRSVRKQHYATEGVAAQFQTDALQPLPKIVKADAGKVALGDKLYHDARLSGDNTLSCASCHALDKGGTDRARSSTGIRGQIGPINSPTVYNAFFNVKQFWDGRAESLQDQAGGPVENPIEMGSNFEQVVEKLQKDAPFVAGFAAVYPDGLNKKNITNAIAEFESTLVTPNSRFDQYLMGKADALTADELEGLRLFRESGCTGCHVGKALGGQSFERMGRKADYFSARGSLTEVDNGRFNITKNETDRHSFKVPTLRNVALTYPYFHDGSQQTLEGAVKIMAQYQTDRPFTDEEAARVAKFLKTLTGEYNGKPL